MAISREAYNEFVKIQEEIAKTLEIIKRGEKEYMEGTAEKISLL